MNKLLKSVIALSLILAPLTSQAASIDPAKSKVVWVGKKITGDSHTGTVAVKEGSLEMKEGKLTGGKIVIDMKTITATDLQGEWKAKLEGHLKNADFFDVEKHSVATFVAKSVKDAGKGKYTVSGDLTIKDTTKTAKLELTKKKDGIYTGKLTFDRAKFNVKYGSKSFFKGLGDKLILDDVTLDITLATK